MQQELLDEIRDVSNEMARRLHFKLETTTEPSDEGVCLVLSGEDEDLLLHKNAAVLFAFDYILNRMFNSRLIQGKKITTDSRNFRSIREEELRLMAVKASEKALTYGQPIDLQPMPPHERRIIHLALRDLPKVRTISEGMGDGRRIVIVPD